MKTVGMEREMTFSNNESYQRDSNFTSTRKFQFHHLGLLGSLICTGALKIPNYLADNLVDANTVYVDSTPFN